MTNGLGATIGTLSAGAVINHFCTNTNGYLIGNWQACWFIFAAYALAVFIAFSLVFKPGKKAATK